MGLLRIFLALSVVITHTAPLFGLQLMPGDVAVKLFFIVSGFYMSLVMAGKYEGKNRTLFFYSNRALRLYPAYFVSLLLTAAVLGAAEYMPSAPEKGALLSETAKWFSGIPGRLDGWSVLAMIIPNLAIFGSDLVYLFHHTAGLGWEFTWGVVKPHADAVRGGTYLLIGPAWSIGVELWFYLLVPLLSRFKTYILVAMAIASLAIRLWMDAELPWSSYFFFPATLSFFLYGMLAHRFWMTSWFKRIPFEAMWGIALFGMFLLIAREFIPGYRNYAALIYAVMVGALPFVFQVFKAISWDRWIGNLSYPVYLVHTAVLSAVHNYTGALSPVLIVSLTMIVSVALTMLVEEPLERYRQRRAARHFSANFAPVEEIGTALGGAHLVTPDTHK
jgi:peptidoglycan/LPS O-acetylase OafA/YrhL